MTTPRNKELIEEFRSNHQNLHLGLEIEDGWTGMDEACKWLTQALEAKDAERVKAVEEAYTAGIERAVEVVGGKMEEWASIEHERWSKWQKYLHSQCFTSPEFTRALIIPADLVARWERQIETPYSELSEKEKESDREQVRPYIKDITTILQAEVNSK